jgi:hypothetical protein
MEAIEFSSQFHQRDSPSVWANLFKREMEGIECYGAFLDGHLIHTSWFTDKESLFISEIGESLELKEGEGCAFDCNTLPQYRGRRAYPVTLLHIARVKKEAGHQSLYIYTFSSNRSSTRGIEATGFRLVERK